MRQLSTRLYFCFAVPEPPSKCELPTAGRRGKACCWEPRRGVESGPPTSICACLSGGACYYFYYYYHCYSYHFCIWFWCRCCCLFPPHPRHHHHLHCYTGTWHNVPAELSAFAFQSRRKFSQNAWNLNFHLIIYSYLYVYCSLKKNAPIQSRGFLIVGRNIHTDNNFSVFIFVLVVLVSAIFLH